MPNREFLEKYPLYRKFIMEVPMLADKVAKPAIHMPCLKCSSDQTFNMINKYWDLSEATGVVLRGNVFHAVYRCSSCNGFYIFFFLKFDIDGKYVMKVGQEPPWDITPDRDLEKMLGQHSYFYKRGLICESQGYGIGAFSYYRRIVDEIIDELLSGISDLLSAEELGKYQEALEKTKNTTVTQDKIELVKDLLPPILRPNGMNPLGTLHTILSEGLHNETDDQCIELAMEVREVLEFLVNQITTTKNAGAKFTEGMQKLLDRRSVKPPKGEVKPSA